MSNIVQVFDTGQGLAMEIDVTAQIDALLREDMATRGAAALLRSGPPVELTALEQFLLDKRRMTMGFVARHDNRVVGYASLHHVVSRSRGSKGVVEDVITAHDYAGRGVGRAVMTTLIVQAFEYWRCRRIDLVCEPHRITARAMYTSLGFVQQEGTDRFVCKTPNTAAYAPTAAGEHPTNPMCGQLLANYSLKPAVPR